MSQIFQEVTDEQKLKILAIFGRTPESSKNDINAIKTWLKKQPHLPEIPSDAMIEIFLKLSKFSIELAKQKIDSFYTLWSRFPEIFRMESMNPNTPLVRNHADICYYISLPKLTDDFCRIVIHKLTVCDPSCYNYAWYNIWAINVVLIRLLEDSTMDTISVIDLKKFTLAHLPKIDFTMLKMASEITKKIFKGSMKAIHFINYPTTIDHILKMLKLILSPKMMGRVVFHNTLDTLYNNVPKQLLPSDYGGDGKSLKELNDKIKCKIAEYNDYFNNLETLKVNENLRPEKLVNDELLGFYGNFKKLDVD